MTVKCVFVTSTGRTGTDFFTHLFNDAISNAWSLHEPRPAFKRRGHRFLAHGYRLDDVAYFAATRHYRHMWRPEEWYVETNYHLFSCIPMLRAAFRKPIIVHIVRDGRDVVRSWLNKGRYLVNEGQLLPWHVADVAAGEQWDSWNALQKLAWYWKTINRVAEQQAPDLLLRFEAVFGSRPSAVYDLLGQMEGIEWSPEAVEAALSTRINSAHRPLVPKFEDWPASWQDQFWEIAGKDMAHWGYA